MTGTILNTITVIIGSTLGLFFGARLPENVRQTVIAGLGIFTLAIGVQMFFQTHQPLVVLGSMLLGGILGEWWQIERGLSNLGSLLESRFMKASRQKSAQGLPGPEATQPSNQFVRAFLTASLVFCIGPMTILGAIQDGLSGDYQLLAIKSVLDGFASLAFASSLGVGVLFSSLTVFVFQGSISLIAMLAGAFISTAMMNEMTAVGGLLLIAIAISSLLEIKPIRSGNFLPALAIAPLLVALLAALGFDVG